MSKLKEALWQDYKESAELISDNALNTDEYKAALEERDRIRKELIELEKIEQEINVKYEQIDSDRDIKLSQIKSESKHERVRNIITIGTFLVTTGVGLYLSDRTFKFDSEGTVTSTLGKNILNGMLPKLFKRQ